MIAGTASHVLADDSGAARERDVLVVIAEGRLGGRREDRLGKLRCLDETPRELDAADGAVGVVGLLAGAGQVTTDDALDRNGTSLLHKHAPARKNTPSGWVLVEAQLLETVEDHVDARQERP